MASSSLLHAELAPYSEPVGFAKPDVAAERVGQGSGFELLFGVAEGYRQHLPSPDPVVLLRFLGQLFVGNPEGFPAGEPFGREVLCLGEGL